MKPLWLAAGIAFIVAGALEALLFGMSCLGVGMGAGATAGFIPLDADEAFLGPFLLAFYSLFFFATLIGGGLHLAAGGAIVSGRRPRSLVWAATVASILPMFTVYCAVPSLIAGVLGMLALLMPDPEAPGAGAAPAA